jgi:hypothetical protein
MERYHVTLNEAIAYKNTYFYSQRYLKRCHVIFDNSQDIASFRNETKRIASEINPNFFPYIIGYVIFFFPVFLLLLCTEFIIWIMNNAYLGIYGDRLKIPYVEMDINVNAIAPAAG